MARLYVVGTPIGNLGDMSPRGLEALASADFIAAEDTRVSLKLLNHFGIKKPVVSYHEHNARGRGRAIVERILSGETCAAVTDAGMPCISDPGEGLVRLCAESGIEVVVVPGPSAVVSALALSGLPAGRFAFEGFLSVQRGSRMEHLAAIRDDPRTLVFYEAPHKLLATLGDMLAALGDRRVALCRELTKLHEEVVRTTLSEAAALFADKAPRGEFVLVVEGARPVPGEKPPLGEAAAIALELRSGGLPLSRAAGEAARRTGHRRGEVYRAALEAEDAAGADPAGPDQTAREKRP